MYIMSDNELTSLISHYDKEVLIRRIGNIKNTQCYLDILELIHTHDFLDTIKSNGIYFNLATVPDETIQIIMDIVGHCEKRNDLETKRIIICR